MFLTQLFIRFATTYLLLNSFANCNPKDHAVTTLIKAKWGVPPPSLEIAEYLADENNNLFWDFVDALSNLEIPLPNLGNDFQRYTESMNAVRQFVNPSQIPLIKLALSMHNYSPRLQAHFQIAKEVLAESDCRSSVFAALDETVICDLEQLKELLTNSEKGSFETYSFDHVYPGTQNNSIPIVLYGQIGSEEFNKFHNYLKQNIFTKDIKYVLRHYMQDTQSHKVYLSGYGVELHLKSTEYKSHDDSPTQPDKQEHDVDEPTEIDIQGYSISTLKRNFPHLARSIDRLRDNLLEKSQEIEPLKPWEFQELGLQAAQRILEIGGEESLHALEFTAQNFPTQAKSLVHQTVPDNFKVEMKHNTEVFARYLNLQPPDSALFINGIYFDGDVIDLNTVLETLRMELKILDGLQKINVKGKLAASLLTLDLQISTTKGFAIDIRDTAVTWINDIESDVQYTRWSPSIMDLTRPTFPGMMRSIRKNLFNLILVVDLIEPNSRNLVRLAESFVQHLAPIRLGIVFDQTRANKTNKANYRAMVCAFNYIVQNRTPRFALGFLTDVFASVEPSESIRSRDVTALFKKTFTHLSREEIKDIFEEESDYEYGSELASQFLEKLGHNSSPQALMNGVPIDQSLLNVDDFEEAILTETLQQTRTLQDAVYRGDLTDADVVIDYLMNQPHVMPRLNQRILSTKDPKYVDLSGTPHNDVNDEIALAKLSIRDITATVLHNLKYFVNKRSDKIRGKSVHLMTLWIVADLDTEQGRSLLQKALDYTKTVGRARIAFIPNADKTKMLSDHNINRLVWAVMQNLPDDEGANMVFDLLSNYDQIETFNIPDKTRAVLFETEPHVQLLRAYCQNVIGVKESQNLLIANGRIYGPLRPDEQLTTDDLNLLDHLIKYQYVDKIRKVLDADTNEGDWSPDSDAILKLITTLVPHQRSQIRFNIPAMLKDDYTVIKVPPRENELFFDIIAFVDPASRGAQKLAPILVLLRNIINCNMRIYFCAVDKHSDMPIKNFYRFVVRPEIEFDYDGKLLAGPQAKFIGLPTKPLLTQNLQVPENWLVEVVSSVYDLDNIKLADIGGPVHSEYELEFLLLEGHCFDSLSGAPPRGLQITLGTNQQTVVVDTTVMANLGYFQLKANPGVWKLRLRKGKSADMFDITNAEGPNTVHKENATVIVISSLNSQVIKLRVTKKPHMMGRDLLDDDDELQSGIWGSITRSFVGRNDEDGADDINIFSVASGHLYERLLRIMMLSLLKHTKSPVKFWFLKNYLSPHFIELLPHMALEYGFKFELVQYKWPRWLHQQSEKQRTIWGYKILFLDVLFPLDVKKIIFVDADAIVRADIKELNDMDLNGAPYAYTPFCDSRQDMEGFRFWKQGYWKNHLMGRKYHISALYVVDLKKFRKIAAGDRLRGQYQALSQDPNSLSNLDQDLPNNMIHQVAIKSLPQEWLWCQTWCSDKSFVNAKVIDLCNNPMTKEAKLTAAQRIVPEWKEYDLEIKRLISRVEDHEMEHDENSATTGKSSSVDEVSESRIHSEL